MKKQTIRNIIFAIIGAFLFGLGCDLGLYSIGCIGFVIDLIAIIIAISRIEN